MSLFGSCCQKYLHLVHCKHYTSITRGGPKYVCIVPWKIPNIVLKGLQYCTCQLASIASPSGMFCTDMCMEVLAHVLTVPNYTKGVILDNIAGARRIDSLSERCIENSIVCQVLTFPRIGVSDAYQTGQCLDLISGNSNRYSTAGSCCTRSTQ